jgi:hypothetical protein
VAAGFCATAETPHFDAELAMLADGIGEPVECIHANLDNGDHADHIGGFTAVLNAGIPVGHALLPAQQYSTPILVRQLGLLLSGGGQAQNAAAGETLALDQAGQVTAQVPNPPEPPETNTTNENSVVLLVNFGQAHFLFAGDIGAKTEASVVARRLGSGQTWPPIDVLKGVAPRLGRVELEAFLERDPPDVCRRERRRRNCYGHPTAAALDRLVAVGAEILRTDRLGTIVTTSDGTTVTVETAPHPSWNARTTIDNIPIAAATSTRSWNLPPNTLVVFRQPSRRRSKWPIRVQWAPRPGFEPGT